MKIIIDEIAMDLNAVKLLARVAETRSFTQAAVSLGLTQSGLSRAIGRLEAELGVRLLHRTTRSVSLTPDGQLFYERCAPLLAELEEVEKLLVDRQCAPSGPLKITTPQALGRIVIMPVLRELTRRYPQLQIGAAMTDRLVDLTEEGFDAAVRLGRVGDVRLIARPLAALRWVTVASPEYLRSHGTPERLEQLAGHNCPTVRDLHTGKLLEWQFQRDGQPLSLAVRGDLVLDVADALVDAALVGQGIGLHGRGGDPPASTGTHPPAVRTAAVPGVADLPAVAAVLAEDRRALRGTEERALVRGADILTRGRQGG